MAFLAGHDCLLCGSLPQKEHFLLLYWFGLPSVDDFDVVVCAVSFEHAEHLLHILLFPWLSSAVL